MPINLTKRGVFDEDLAKQIGNALQTAGAAPASPTSAGVAGSIAYDATHIYVCVATNSWVRNVTAFSTFV